MKRLLYFILMGVNYRRKEHPERAKAPFRCSFVCWCCVAADTSQLGLSATGRLVRRHAVTAEAMLEWALRPLFLWPPP
jgi:hypothetical protein